MIRITPRISRLAASIVKPASIRVNAYREASLSTYSRTLQSFCSIAQFDSSKIKTSIRLQAAYIQQSKRHCSHRRTMCKANADIIGGSMDVGKGREVLPTNVKPVHYDLTLEPDFEKFSYEGTVIIEYAQPRAIIVSKLPLCINIQRTVS